MQRQLTFRKAEDFEGFACSNCQWNYRLPEYGNPDRKRYLRAVQSSFDEHSCHDYERRVEMRKSRHGELLLGLSDGTAVTAWSLDESEHGRHVIHKCRQLPAEVTIDGVEARVVWNHVFGESVETGLALRRPCAGPAEP